MIYRYCNRHMRTTLDHDFLPSVFDIWFTTVSSGKPLHPISGSKNHLWILRNCVCNGSLHLHGRGVQFQQERVQHNSTSVGVCSWPTLRCHSSSEQKCRLSVALYHWRYLCTCIVHLHHYDYIPSEITIVFAAEESGKCSPGASKEFLVLRFRDSHSYDDHACSQTGNRKTAGPVLCSETVCSFGNMLK